MFDYNEENLGICESFGTSTADVRDFCDKIVKDNDGELASLTDIMMEKFRDVSSGLTGGMIMSLATIGLREVLKKQYEMKHPLDGLMEAMSRVIEDMEESDE